MATDEEFLAFTDAYNKVWDLYDQEKMEDCVAAAEELLEIPDLTRFHRIKTLIVLACALEEWRDIEITRREAETLWALAQRYNESTPGVVATLAELRTSLNQLQQHQIDTQPPCQSPHDSDDENFVEGAEEVAQLNGSAEEGAAAAAAATDGKVADSVTLDEAGLARVFEDKVSLKMPHIVVDAPTEEASK